MDTVLIDANRADPVPLYHRAYLLLRQRILDGEWPASQPMPGEIDLAVQLRLSRITIRRALQRLEQEGLILRRRGAGTFTRPPALAKRRENLRGLLENLLAMGLRTKVRLIHFAYVAAPPDVAAALELPAGSLVQKSVRVRTTSDGPFSHLTSWVPEPIGRTYQAEDLAARPLLALLEQAGYPAATAEQVISARLADSAVAPLLGVQPGSPLIWARRQVRNAGGQVIEWIEALYRPEMYEYQINLVREGPLWTTAGNPTPL